MELDYLYLIFYENSNKSLFLTFDEPFFFWPLRIAGLARGLSLCWMRFRLYLITPCHLLLRRVRIPCSFCLYVTGGSCPAESHTRHRGVSLKEYEGISETLKANPVKQKTFEHVLSLLQGIDNDMRITLKTGLAKPSFWLNAVVNSLRKNIEILIFDSGRYAARPSIVLSFSWLSNKNLT